MGRGRGTNNAGGNTGGHIMGARPGTLAPIGFGMSNLVSAGLVALGVFGGLPTRSWVIDLPAVVVIGLLGTAGGGLLARRGWAVAVARLASAVTLVLGLALVGLLAVTVSYLRGIYGPVGRGGALIVTLVAALALPYLVVLPAGQLVWLGPPGRTAANAPPPPDDGAPGRPDTSCAAEG
jgi:hypothetical protein